MVNRCLGGYSGDLNVSFRLRLLDANGYPPEWNDEVFDQVLDQVENYKTHQSN